MVRKQSYGSHTPFWNGFTVVDPGMHWCYVTWLPPASHGNRVRVRNGDIKIEHTVLTKARFVRLLPSIGWAHTPSSQYSEQG